jgi:signal transduction histidine kinase/CheY-like chemotaxis protein
MGNEIRLSLLNNIGSSVLQDQSSLADDGVAVVAGGGIDSKYALLIADEKGHIHHANEAARILLDYDLATLKQRKVSDLVLRLDDRVMGLVFNLVRFDRPVVIDALCARRNGSWFSVEIHTVTAPSAVSGNDGTRIGLILKELKRQLEHDTGVMGGISGASRAESIEMATVVAGQIAHDFNNLLTPLLAYPELMRHELPADTPVAEYLEIIEKTAEDMQRLTQQLLSLARRGRGGADVFCPNETIRQAVSSLMPSFTPGITVNLDLAENLSNITGGLDQVRLVIDNLVQNAVEAMGSSGLLTVRTENVYLDTPVGASTTLNIGEYVEITVTDTGTGMSPEVRGRIFDPFFTTKKVLKKRGAGLGLSIVHGIVRDHRGYIDLESEPGKGASFHVYFPVSRSPAQSGMAMNLPRGNERVLVIDDDAPQVEVVTSLLKLLGYQVSGAASGEQALNLMRVEKKQFDLILLDMVMDMGIDGLETFREIRKIVPDQRVILMSGHAKITQRVAKAQELGAGMYLRKPLSVQSLSQAVRDALDARHEVKLTAPTPVALNIIIV